MTQYGIRQQIRNGSDSYSSGENSLTQAQFLEFLELVGTYKAPPRLMWTKFGLHSVEATKHLFAAEENKFKLEKLYKQLKGLWDERKRN